MYQANYYTLTFMIRKAQQKKSGEVPVFARITISGQRTEFNINRSVNPKDWNPSKGNSKGKTKRDALRVSPRQLQTLKANGKLGYFQEAGGNCLFRESDIVEFLSSNRVEADGSL